MLRLSFYARTIGSPRSRLDSCPAVGRRVVTRRRWRGPTSSRRVGAREDSASTEQRWLTDGFDDHPRDRLPGLPGWSRDAAADFFTRFGEDAPTGLHVHGYEPCCISMKQPGRPGTRSAIDVATVIVRPDDRLTAIAPCPVPGGWTPGGHATSMARPDVQPPGLASSWLGVSVFSLYRPNASITLTALNPMCSTMQGQRLRRRS